MNRYFTIGALVCLVVSSCNKPNTPSFEMDDQAIEQTYTPQEVNALSNVISFMDSTVLAGCNGQDVAEAYTEFFANTTFSEPNFNEAALNGLVNKMKETGIFSEFWTIQRIDSPDSLKGVYLDFNMNGKLFKLIEIVGQEEEVIGEYYGYLMRDRDISPALVAMFPYDFANVNYKRPSVRLVLAAHFIYLSESKKYSTKKVKALRIEDEENGE